MTYLELVYISLCQEEKETCSHNDRFYSPFDESEEIQCADFRVRVWLFLIGRYIVASFVESDLLISAKYISFFIKFYNAYTTDINTNEKIIILI